MEDLEQEIGSWERTAKDLVSGAAGGIAQVLLGQPFGELPTMDCTGPGNFYLTQIYADLRQIGIPSIV
jgi:hypothetical protein